MRQQCKSLLILGLLALSVGFVISLFVFKHKSSITLAPKAATVFNTARTVDHFTLNNQQNQEFTEEKLRNHWTFMFFGFTRCNSICPATMGVLKQVYDKLPTSTKDPAQVVFVTVDPEYDTPEKLADYVTSFNENFVGVTGSQEQLSQLQHTLGIMAMPVSHSDDENMIEHSGSIIVIDPQGEFYALFTSPHDVDTIIGDYKNMTKYYYSHQHK